MNGAPDWQDGEFCFRCRTQFSLVARKHHCRNCGNIFCAKCSANQIPLPKLNIDKNVRVCDTCYEKIGCKNEDPLTLALDSKDTANNSTKSEQNKPKSSSSKSSTGKQNASAPSEQEIIEQEQLELALALSLSETPTKVSFPDCQHLEVSSSNSNNITNKVGKNTTSTALTTISASSTPTTNATLTNNMSQSTSINSISPVRVNATQPEVLMAPTLNHFVEPVAQPPMHYVQEPYPAYQMPERDLNVFRNVGEIQQTLETFNNRLESCKLRNRPVANDSAIQSLFIKLNAEYQPKLNEFIKTYEEERADYERLQDKLSQIADARAALDALREEHQEKVRQQAAEAEKQRQSQLATKLESMRQKKTQMMQYQRELALQRIREQEQMGMQNQQPPPSTQSYQTTPAIMSQQIMSHQNTFDPMQQIHSTQSSPSVHQQEWRPSVHQQTTTQAYPPSSYVPAQPQYEVPQQQQQQQQPPAAAFQQQLQQQQPIQQQATYVPTQSVIDRASIAQLERQYLPNTKPEEDTPLISFDD